MQARTPSDATPPYARIPSYMTTFQSSPVRIWNTVNKLCQKLSKFDRGFCSVGSKLNLPPKTCIPSRAKITMNKNRRSKSDAIDWIELRSDATRFDSERQYLFEKEIKKSLVSTEKFTPSFLTYLVTLNTLRRRTQRSTEIPNGGIMCVWNRIISPILPMTTKQSKRLNNDTKYPWKPKLYILRNISIVKSATKNMFVYSVEKLKR